MLYLMAEDRRYCETSPSPFLNCNPKLGELHFAKRTSAWIPRRCNSSPKGSASWTIDHKNSFILGEHFAVQISLIQSKIGVAAKQRYPLCLDYLVEASESLQPFERESFVKLNDRDDDATRLSDDDGDATRLRRRRQEQLHSAVAERHQEFPWGGGESSHDDEEEDLSSLLTSCVTKACSIVEAVVDLNSTSSDLNQFRFTSTAVKKADLMEPSFEKYVTVKRGGCSLEEQESSCASNNLT
ncbi:hypothetical protein Bca4012_061859 [Brassica carinata]